MQPFQAEVFHKELLVTVAVMAELEEKVTGQPGVAALQDIREMVAQGQTVYLEEAEHQGALAQAEAAEVALLHQLAPLVAVVV
jgi:hypothetical protein